MTWTVYTTWRALPDGWTSGETASTFPDWPQARRHGLQAACLAGVRYVTVVDPDHVIAADYDRLTHRWCEYALHIGACDNYLELEDRPCDGQLYARPCDIQTRCPRCRAWIGCRARGMRLPFEPAT